jgi:hypothetical protein
MRGDVLRRQRRLRILVVAQLVVDAPDVVGLAVHQQRRARIRRRVEPRQPLHRPLRRLHDVGDDVAAFVLRAFQRQPELLAHRAAAAIAGHQPIGLHGARAAGAGHAHGDACAILLHGDDPVRPGHLRRWCLQRLVHELLDVELLDVDHRREALRGLVRHLEAQHLAVAEEAAPAGPRQRLGLHGRLRAGPAQDLLRAARDADRAAAGAIGGIGFHDQRGNAVTGK